MPGGSLDNLARAGDWTTWPDHASRVDRVLLADAQTSGGLLIAVAPDRLDALLAALDARGVACRAVIGECTVAGTGRIVVR